MSEACQQVREDLGGYVLGALEPAEAERVRAHLDGCPECAAEYRELARLPELLDLSAGLDPETVSPPAGLEERLLDSVARESERPRARPSRRPRRRWRDRRLVGAGAAVTALAAAAVIAVVVVGGEDAPDPEAPGYEVAMTAGPGAPGASARADLEAVDGGTELHLWVKGLARDPDEIYEVRCDGGGTSASAGTFRVDRAGKAYVVLTTAARQGEYDRIRVLRRSPPPGQRAQVLQAELRG